MSYYYSYKFVSPEGNFATVKEEFKSYFDTGAVDDLMFPTYLNKCLRRLGNGTYPIVETIMFVENYQARLPDNFYAVREAWLCTDIDGNPYQSPSSFYSQAATANTVQICPVTTDEDQCANFSTSDPCTQNAVMNIYKTNSEINREYVKQYLLKPGNISVRSNCGVSYLDSIDGFRVGNNPYGAGYDSFDIRDNKFVTSFMSGIVYMLFYSEDMDCSGNQMIPDNFRIQEYIEAFLKYKLMETLTNQVNDETFNQLLQKLAYYKQQSDECYIMANTELMKQTVWEKQLRIKESKRRFNMYELPNRTNRYGKRRNM